MKPPRIDKHINFPKTTWDELYQLKKEKRVSINTIVVNAVEEYLHPPEKEGNEKAVRQSLNSLLNYVKKSATKDDIIIILLTEIIKCIYYTTKQVDKDFDVIQKERMNSGLEAVMKRVEAQIIGDRKGVLDRLELKE